jgi:hypothetical protein
MTTPQNPDPYGQDDPGGYQAPDPAAYQPPSGAYQPPATPASGYPTGQPAGYPTGQPAGYPTGQAGAYPTGQPGGYPPPGPAQPGGYPVPGQPVPGSYPPPGQPVVGGGYPPAPPGGGYPPPPGGPGGYPPPSGAPVPPGTQQPKSNTPRVIIAVAVVLVVVLGVVLYLVNRKSDPSSAAAGDCVKVNSVTADDADVDKVDCGDPNATYKVTASGGAVVLCDSQETEYTEKTSDGDTTTTLCLQPNVKAGDCLRVPEDQNASISKVACSSAIGDKDVIKVVAFDHTTSLDSACPDDAEGAVTYTIHTGVLCYKANS